MALSVTIGTLHLQNPVMVASGTFGYGKEYEKLVEIHLLGAIVTKTITRNPRAGNPQPRLVETPAGMLNAIGLQNEGLENFLTEKWPSLSRYRPPIIVSISGQSPADYVYLAQRLEQTGVRAVELNLSCPNIHYTRMGGGCRLFAQSEQSVSEIVSAVKKSVGLTVIAKLSPNVTDIVSVARAAEDAGADALSLINTLIGMAIDVEKRRPMLANTSGGLSGPAIRPVAVYMVYQVCRSIRIPVIGMGGISSLSDALEFILAGATAVSVGTANYVNPATATDIIRGLRQYITRNQLTTISELRGKLCQ